MIKGEEIIESYAKFCSLRNSIVDNKLDLGKIPFLYPTTIVPLMVLCEENKLSFNGNIDSGLKSYLDIVTGQVAGKPFNSSQSYICIQSFPKDETKVDIVHQNINTLISGDSNIPANQGLRWLLSELSDNIYQHSRFNNAFLMLQKFKTKGFVEFVILDNGRSIYGSYVNNGFPVADGIEALKNALSGVSTKKDKERGTGLPSSVDLVVKGFKGAIAIISATGIAYIDQDTKKLYKLEKQQEYKGTIIVIRLPFPLPNLTTEAFYEIIEPK